MRAHVLLGSVVEVWPLKGSSRALRPPAPRVWPPVLSLRNARAAQWRALLARSVRAFSRRRVASLSDVTRRHCRKLRHLQPPHFFPPFVIPVLVLCPYLFLSLPILMCPSTPRLSLFSVPPSLSVCCARMLQSVIGTR